MVPPRRHSKTKIIHLLPPQVPPHRKIPIVVVCNRLNCPSIKFLMPEPINYKEIGSDFDIDKHRSYSERFSSWCYQLMIHWGTIVQLWWCGNNVLSLHFRNVMCCQEACHPLAQAGLQNFWQQEGFIGNTFEITMFFKIVLQFLYHQKSLIHRQEIVQWRAGSIWWCHVLLLCCAMFRKDKLYILHRACACQLSSCEMSNSRC